MNELAKAYEAKQFENEIYQIWEKSGLFSPKIVQGKKPFTVSMPPPNATGTLHLGHATMLAIEDILVRYKRMQGFPTLWIPGTDHAGIATQNKVEKIIAEEGLTRAQLGRENFLKRVDEFVENSRSTIRNQMRKMGSSCDWTRERYTLDQGLSEAVREVFVRMYNDGLIYRGERIVNWCPRCSSTLSDEEVEFKEEKTKFYYLKYGPVTIGTARPETKFLDKTIIVHPNDSRYLKFHGQKNMVPWIDGTIEATFIADQAADPEFGTGAMTITPAHDFIDFEIAKRHKLPIVQIIGPDGNFTTAVTPEFQGKNARASRDQIVEILKQKGLLERVDENYTHNLSVCYRCGTAIEPLISKQWFVDVEKPVIKHQGQLKSLKQRGAETVRNGEIKIIPNRFDKIYFHWLDNLKDWCISRQLWFGHQIPVWYCHETLNRTEKCSQPLVAIGAPSQCPNCQSTNLIQDPDTLDTWFSSGLWTFSTLGWPQKTTDLEYFHPTSVLETGHDILFFWVARMILMTTYALDQVPFETVYLHGLVRDRDGKKMSKSKGNGIDPLDMIEKFGTDAVRLSLVIGTAAGTDFRLYEEKIAGYRNFVNKIWNGCRFAIMNIPEEIINANSSELNPQNIKTHADKWIVSQLQKLIKEVTIDLEKFELSEAGTKIYDFFWNQYCDWYIELTKGEQLNPEVLLFVLKNLLKLLHPFVPFITEVLWQNLKTDTLLIGESWPEFNSKLIFEAEEAELQIVKAVITSIRSVRAEKAVEPGKKIKAQIYAGKYTNLLESKREPIMRMARLEKLELTEVGAKIDGAIWQFVNGIDIYLPLDDLIDMEKERLRLNKKILENQKMMAGLESRLNNAAFIGKAPEAVVLKEKELYQALEAELNSLQQQYSQLKL